jgi:hypothetical protein
MKSNNSIILCENDKIVNDPKGVTEIFNNFFVNVAKDIGDKNIKIDKTHPSINKVVLIFQERLIGQLIY